MGSSLVQMVKEVWSARAVVHQLVRQYLLLRYRRTMLGYLWTLVNPLLMMSVTAFVFANLFRADLKTFAVFLFAGMIPWNCFSTIVIQSSCSFINNEGLIRKIYLPKMVFPLSTCIGILIDSVLSLAALFIIILLIGGPASWALLFLPVAYLILFVFSFGIALIISIATVYSRDVQHVIAIIMQALFFLTPVLYDKSAMAGKFAYILHLNPLSQFIELFRQPIRNGALPALDTVIAASIMAIISLAIGLWFFFKNEKKIIFRL